MTREVTRVALLVALLWAPLVSCSDEQRATPVVNTIVITLTDARADLLDEVADSGAAPTLAAWRALACWRGTRRGEALGRAAAAAEFDAAWQAWIGASNAEVGANARFVSHSDLATRGDAIAFAGPPIVDFNLDLGGPLAAPTELTRSAEATADAAIAWLATATSPFTLQVQFEAGACRQEPGESPLPPNEAGLRARARERLLAIDRALAPLVGALAHGGRERRTRVVVATTGGEALGEEGRFGPRHDVASVRTTACWRIEPEGASASVAPPPWIVATLNDPRPVALHPLDPAALPLPLVHPLPARDDAQARELLDRLHRSAPLVAATPRLREFEAATLFLLDQPSAAEQSQRAAIERRWASQEARAETYDLRLLTLLARGDVVPNLSGGERIALARRALSLAPWYFPAARVLAALLQAQGDAVGALSVIDQYGRDAPLAPSARSKFETLLATTRAHLEGATPGRRD